MGKIVKVSGPLVVATGLEEANMADVVRVGEQRLIGEILTMNSGSASIQVYEETSGLGPGAEVVTTGSPLSVELGPGLVENIYDGIQRPLDAIMKKWAAITSPAVWKCQPWIVRKSGSLPLLPIPVMKSSAVILSVQCRRPPPFCIRL